MKLLKNNIKIVAYCFLLSFGLLFVTSRCSFMYPLNDWVDANAFFTVGKGMAHGVIPYLQIFEQKGVLLYFIYMIGYLISNTTFHGVFILEVISWTFTLYYAYKIITLFLSKRSAKIILPIFMVLMCTAKAFVQGGSAEEFSMPFMMLTFYYFFKHYKTSELSYKEFTIAGFCAGCVLLIKYTLLGFWFGFMASLFFTLLFNKETKKAFLSCVWFLIGMFIPVFIALIYFGVNEGIKEFIQVYFLTNLNSYTNETSNFIIRLITIAKGFIITVLSNGALIALALIGFVLFIFKLDIRTKAKIDLIFMYGCSIILIFFGLRFYTYYLYPMLIFILISIIVLFSFIDKKISNIKVKNFNIILTCLCLVVFIYSFIGNNSKAVLGVKKDEMFQYEFASIMLKENNPTMVNMGFLDCGVYTTSGIIANTYFFEKQNIDYKRFPNNLDSFKNYINNKKTMFIVYYTRNNLSKVKSEEQELFENYELIKRAKPKYENKEFNAFLFKVKEV